MNQHVLHAVKALRRNGFADDPVAVTKPRQEELALFIAGCPVHDFACVGVNQAELRARQRLPRRIDLQAANLLSLVGDGRNRLFRVDERAIHREPDFRIRLEIAGERLRFNKRIRSERHFFKRRHPLCVCFGGHHQHPIRLFQTEHHARKRFAVFIHLVQRKARVVVANRRVARDVSIRIDGKPHLRFIQRIAVRGIRLFERVRSRRDGNLRELSVRIGRFAINYLSLFVSDLDGRARQRLLPGDIRLGQRHAGINQLVMHDFRQAHANHAAALRFRLKRHGKLRRIELPPVRRGQLFDVIRAMREVSDKRQPARRVRRARRHKRIRRQRHVADAQFFIGKQAEHKALTGGIHKRLPHMIAIHDDFQILLFLLHRDFRGQIAVAQRHVRFDHRRVVVFIAQLDLVRRAIQQISFRRAYLDQLIPPQRKLLRRILSRFRRRDRVRHVARMKPNRPVFSDNIRRRAQLKDRARKISFLIHGLMHDVTESVRLLFQTHKLQALLLDHHPAHDGFIRDFDIQRIRFAGRIARFAHKHPEPFRADEVPLRRMYFFNEIHAARHRFRQRHLAVFIGVEGVDLPARRIAHRLRYHVSVAVQQLERRVRQPDGFARFRIRLDELEPIPNRLIVDRQNRWVGNVLVAANEDFHGAFERVSRFALHLLQDVQAIRKQLGFGIAVPVGHEIIPLKRPRIAVASGFFEVQLKLRALLRRFNQARIVVNFVVAEEFHDGVHALFDDVELQSLIRHDRRFGLTRRAPRIHEEVRVAGFIPDRRGRLDDFIQPRPQLARYGARIVARRRQRIHNRIALFEQYVALPVPDLRARQHAENRARQLAVAARARRVDTCRLGQLVAALAVRVVAAVLVAVPLIELELHHDGLIRRAKLRRFVRTHRRVQRDFFHNVARRRAALAHDVPALAQRR